MTLEELQNKVLELEASNEVLKSTVETSKAQVESLTEANKTLKAHNAKLFARVTHQPDEDDKTKEKTKSLDYDKLTDELAKGGY